MAVASLGQELLVAIRQTLREVLRDGRAYLSPGEATTYLGVSLRSFETIARDLPCHRLSPGEKWWLYERPRSDLYEAIRGLQRCFVSATTTKYLNFSALPNTFIFSNTIKIFPTDRWDLFTVVQSTLHEVWAGQKNFKSKGKSGKSGDNGSNPGIDFRGEVRGGAMPHISLLQILRPDCIRKPRGRRPSFVIWAMC